MNEIICKLTDEDKFIVPSQHIEYNINDSSIYSYTMF